MYYYNTTCATTILHVLLKYYVYYEQQYYIYHYNTPCILYFILCLYCLCREVPVQSKCRCAEHNDNKDMLILMYYERNTT